MIRNINIWTKLVLGFLVVALFFIPAIYVPIHISNMIKTSFDDIIGYQFPRLQALLEIKASSLQLQSMINNIDFGAIRNQPDPQATINYHKDKILAVLAEIDKWEKQYNTHISYKEKSSFLDIKELDNLKDKIILNSLELLQLAEQGAPVEKIIEEKKQLDQLLNSLSVFINTSLALETKYLNQNKAETDENTETAVQSSLLFAITVFVIAILMSFILSRILAKPIIELRNAATAIANGNLRQKITLHTNTNEIVELAESMQTMIQNLLKSNADLSSALENLKKTQTQLVDSEKLASLGALVAGISHEVNTPIGIGVTAVTHMAGILNQIQKDLENNTLKRSSLESFLKSSTEAAHLVEMNLNRAAQLIKSFKQVSADHVSEAKRVFQLKEYLDEIILSLHPTLKKTKLTTEINCATDIVIDSYPGILFQVITILVMNSVTHAFNPGEEGKISINVSDGDKMVTINYSDNGKGISPENLKKVFEPFFTTKRGKGGIGLGLNIAYNRIVQLGGEISCASTLGEGTTFIINIPKKSA